jgi:hypothetical protein
MLCSGRIIPGRNPLDGALDATHIVIVRQQFSSAFVVEQSFLGDVGQGHVLELPGLEFIVADYSTGVGVERKVPIHDRMRILIFLKRASDPEASKAPAYGDWVVAGYGNCYFFSDGDPQKNGPLQTMAAGAVEFRRAWEAARDTADEQQRVEALWPFLWKKTNLTFERTKEELEKIGPAAGDYIADQLRTMTDQQKELLILGFAKYHSSRLHAALIEEITHQQANLTESLQRSRKDASEDRSIGVVYYGLADLAGFEDRADLPFARESALWAVKYRFMQVSEAALLCFQKMPAKENLPIIAAIWREYSRMPSPGRETPTRDFIAALNNHRFLETIPLMAQFVNATIDQGTARQFLVTMTGVDYGGDEAKWLQWYESHRASN